MKTTYNLAARKRPVNLTLNEDLLVQVRGLTDNLSGVVESLLADYARSWLNSMFIGIPKSIGVPFPMWCSSSHRCMTATVAG